jgi:hypothetical protein
MDHKENPSRGTDKP